MSADPQEFELEQPTPGMPSEHVIEELVHCFNVAKDYAGAFRDAVKAQAEKHKLSPSALRKYVAARAGDGDKMEALNKEADDLERLLSATEEA